MSNPDYKAAYNELRGTLIMVLKGLRSGSVRSKPIMTGMDDPKATEYGVESLENVVERSLAKAAEITIGTKEFI